MSAHVDLAVGLGYGPPAAVLLDWRVRVLAGRGPALILEVIVRDHLAVLDDRDFAPDRLA
jgi:hypothetical protein